MFVIDCKTNRAYVPLPVLDIASGHGRVLVLDLTQDPNKTDPRIGIVLLSQSSIPHGAALDQTRGVVFVPSGGSLDLIRESTDTLVAGSPFALPAGTETGIFGQVIFDSAGNNAITGARCSLPGTCTGLTPFDELTQTFGSMISAADPQALALDHSRNLLVDSSPLNQPHQIAVVDINNAVSCTLKDSNLALVSHGVSTDLATGLVVIGNADGTATVVNLNRSTFTSTKTPCNVQEGGTQPNSVVVKGLALGTAGAAVNPTTHEAFLTDAAGGSVTLLILPSAPVRQIGPAMLNAISATLPQDPSLLPWTSSSAPYGVAVANCPNGDFGYAVNSDFTYLVQVDLAQLKANPGSISTPLPSGNCKGTSSLNGCSNGNGVTFFPVLLGLP